MGPSRIARPSSTQALRQVGVIGDLPIDLQEKVQAGLELRPQRWEEYTAYNIMRWKRRISSPAVAGRFGAIVFTGAGGIDDRDSFHVVESISNIGAGVLAIRVDDALVALANIVSGGAYPLDARLGADVELFPGMWQSGDAAALAGGELHFLQPVPASGQPDEITLGWVGAPARGPGGAFVQVFGSAVNTAIAINVSGYTVRAR